MATVKQVRRKISGNVFDTWTEGALIGDSKPEGFPWPWPEMSGTDTTQDDLAPVIFTFDADFTAADEARWRQVVRRVRAALEAPDDALLDAEIAVMKAFLNEPSPTATQTVTAVKAVIRALRELMKDDV